MENILEIEGLKKKYEDFELYGVSFAVPAGSVVGFVGPNGAGKTTTIKIILNAIKPDSGKVTIFGSTDIAGHIKDIGVVMDSPLYASSWTVKDVENALRPFYSGWDSGKFAEYMESFGLSCQKEVKALSRGMKVKLQIAAAMSHGAKLLVLDEPTSGLDPVARSEICTLIKGFVADGDRSVLFSTHITSDLDKTADYVVCIINGGIAFNGRREAILDGCNSDLDRIIVSLYEEANK